MLGTQNNTIISEEAPSCICLVHRPCSRRGTYCAPAILYHVFFFTGCVGDAVQTVQNKDTEQRSAHPHAYNEVRIRPRIHRTTDSHKETGWFFVFKFCLVHLTLLFVEGIHAGQRHTEPSSRAGSARVIDPGAKLEVGPLMM